MRFIHLIQGIHTKLLLILNHYFLLHLEVVILRKLAVQNTWRNSARAVLLFILLLHEILAMVKTSMDVWIEINLIQMVLMYV